MGDERRGAVVLVAGVLGVTGCGERTAGAAGARADVGSKGAPAWLAPARPVGGDRADRRPMALGAVRRAVARLRPAHGYDAAGRVGLVQEDGALRVRGELEGLEPGQRHVLVIHEYGDCSAPDACSAGRLFPPEPQGRGAPGQSVSFRHAGDLGWVVPDTHGRARVVRRVERFSLTRDRAVLGRSVVVHVARGSVSGEPGDSLGARIACGAIAVAGPTE